jgi:hypothetical protein
MFANRQFLIFEFYCPSVSKIYDFRPLSVLSFACLDTSVQCVPVVSFSSRPCLPMSPACLPCVTQCLLFCVSMSPYVSQCLFFCLPMSPVCLPMSPVCLPCLPMSPNVSHCLFFCLPKSRVSIFSFFCTRVLYSMSPFLCLHVSQCLPMSPIVSQCLLFCVSLSPNVSRMCPACIFFNSTVVTQSSLSIPFFFRSSLLHTELEVTAQ